MGRNGTRTERLNKKERERNDLAEGPRSRAERNDFKKVGTCPALVSWDTLYLIQYMKEYIQNYSSTVMFRGTPCI